MEAVYSNSILDSWFNEVDLDKAVLITGAAGFLGVHLCKKFLEADYKVVGLDNLVTGQIENIRYLQSLPAQNQFSFFERDISKNPFSQEFLNLIRKYELSYILHFASPASPKHYLNYPLETLWANTIGLRNCLELARELGARVVFASTSEIYGDSKIRPLSESHWGYVNSFGERSCYNEAKRCGEALIHSFNKVHNSRHGLVRIFNTYGPRMNMDDGRLIINFLNQALKNENLTIYGDGNQTRSFCYVDDLIDGVFEYAHKDICEPVNLGNTEEYSVSEVARIIQEFFPEKQLKIEFKPLPSDDPRNRCPDISKALKLLAPWSPKMNLKTGVKKLIETLAQ